MQIHEFIEKVKEFSGDDISDNLDNATYEIIETVYTYHPKVKDKDTIAELFCRFGLILILDMHPRAERIMQKEREIQLAKQNLAKLQEEMEMLMR